MNDDTAIRVADAIELSEQQPEQGVLAIDERIQWLMDEHLAESVPLGAPTEGGGVLITAVRLRYELDRAHREGGLAIIEHVAKEFGIDLADIELPRT